LSVNPVVLIFILFIEFGSNGVGSVNPITGAEFINPELFCGDIIILYIVPDVKLLNV